MAVSYKKLWHILLDKNMKKKDLREALSWERVRRLGG